MLNLIKYFKIWKLNLIKEVKKMEDNGKKMPEAIMRK